MSIMPILTTTRPLHNCRASSFLTAVPGHFNTRRTDPVRCRRSRILPEELFPTLGSIPLTQGTPCTYRNWFQSPAEPSTLTAQVHPEPGNITTRPTLDKHIPLLLR